MEKINEIVTDSPVLSFYDASRTTVVSDDASSCGLGAALYQMIDGHFKPIVFVSRTTSMAESERRYVQNEKEYLAAVWACEKFDQYLITSA